MDGFGWQDNDFPATLNTGVFNYTVGNCNITDVDAVYPAWMDLPPHTITMKTGISSSHGTEGTYFDVTLSGVGSGYDVADDTYGIWCGDKGADIYLNTTYQDVKVLSSLAPLPNDITINEDQLGRINWLFNNLDYYIPNIDLFNLDTWAIESGHGDDWSEIQNAIWEILEDQDAPAGSLGEEMAEDSVGHEGYKVLPGQWAAVLFWKQPTIQILFLVVDP
jgi:hypothetical protein